ncbi:MAG: polysaccharide biosynthesis tyrosine autokinase [Acidimicrobiales bacterium]
MEQTVVTRSPLGSGARSVDLIDRLRVLLRYKWLVVLITVLAAGASYVWFSSRTTQYRAEAVLLANDKTTQTDPFSTELNTPAVQIQDRDVATQIQILESPPIRAIVRGKLSRAPKAQAVQVGSTNEFAVEVVDHDPVLAAHAATEYAQAYIAFERQQSVADDSAAAASVSAQVSSLQSQLDAVQGEILHLAAGDPKLALLQQLHQNLLQQQSVFQQKLDELNVDVELKSSPAQLVAPAEVPTLPVAPRVRRNTALSTIGALFLACVVAFGIDYVDDRITSREETEAASAGVPILGCVPRMPSVRNGASSVNIMTTGPTSGLAESFRSLRTNVQFLNLEDGTASILVTSASASEGKTTVAANLAVTLGRAGLRVALVDADLRRPALQSFFGLEESAGLSAVLSGAVDWRNVLQTIPGEPNVEVLTAGNIPPNPSELLGSDRTRDLLAELESVFDQVIVDTPPSLPVTDAVALSQRVDSCLLVVLAGKSKKRQVARCTQLLRQVNAPIAGVVVNGLSSHFDDGYGYGYGYGYRYEQPIGNSKGSVGRRDRRQKSRSSGDETAVPVTDTVAPSAWCPSPGVDDALALPFPSSPPPRPLLAPPDLTAPAPGPDALAETEAAGGHLTGTGATRAAGAMVGAAIWRLSRRRTFRAPPAP